MSKGADRCLTKKQVRKRRWASLKVRLRRFYRAASWGWHVKSPNIFNKWNMGCSCSMCKKSRGTEPYKRKGINKRTKELKE